MTIQRINLSQADRGILNDLPIFVNDLTAEMASRLTELVNITKGTIST